MSEYYQYLKSDIYKLRHSWFLGVHLLFPVFGAVLMLFYSRLSSGSRHAGNSRCNPQEKVCHKE